MKRLLALGVWLAWSGCQCLEPVSDVPDASVRADAGATADAGPSFTPDGGAECATPVDCQGAPWLSQQWLSQWCQFPLAHDAGFSCIDERCVAECFVTPRRDCTVSGECLTCPGEADLCPLDTCPTNAFSAVVTDVQCRPGFTPQLRVGETLSFVPIRGASCEMSVSGEGRGFGQVTRGAQRHAWFVRELGGWCLGEELMTGAIRSQVACPSCTFVVDGF